MSCICLSCSGRAGHWHAGVSAVHSCRRDRSHAVGSLALLAGCDTPRQPAPEAARPRRGSCGARGVTACGDAALVAPQHSTGAAAQGLPCHNAWEQCMEHGLAWCCLLPCMCAGASGRAPLLHCLRCQGTVGSTGPCARTDYACRGPTVGPPGVRVPAGRAGGPVRLPGVRPWVRRGVHCRHLCTLRQVAAACQARASAHQAHTTPGSRSRCARSGSDADHARMRAAGSCVCSEGSVSCPPRALKGLGELSRPTVNMPLCALCIHLVRPCAGHQAI